MHPRKKGLEALPNFGLLDDKPVDFVLISHAHQDHLNALPFLVKKLPHIKIITTPQTRALAELTLRNSISILKSQTTNTEIEIYSHKCIYCGACYSICPTGALKLNIDEIHYSGAYNSPFWDDILGKLKVKSE